MALLLEVYPGSAVDLWNNFPDYFIKSVIKETVELRKTEEDRASSSIEKDEELNNMMSDEAVLEKLKKMKELKK